MGTRIAVNQTVAPQTDEEHTIHAINIQGVFFEKWCQDVFGKDSNWTLRAINYPVEFPEPNGPWRGSEGELDLRADLQIGDRLLTLLIECKKNNPNLVNWVFFPKQPVGQTPYLTVTRI